VEINKSTRHQKIIGDYGEALVCNWFSRSGFEVTIVDHTGIDIVAYNPETKKRLGVTVKSRTRDNGKEGSSVNILSYQKDQSDKQKLLDACEAFACDPWIAIYVESTRSADLYLLSLDHYDSHYKGTKKRAIDDWKMTDVCKRNYASDPEIKHIHMDYNDSNWDWKIR